MRSPSRTRPTPTWLLLVFLLPTALAASACAGGKPAVPDPAAALEPIRLPDPDMEGGRPLMDALKDRRSARAYRSDEIPLPVLSNLLWAAYGINRPASAKRTAPSALDWQETDIYVVMERGAYLYDAEEHVLLPVSAEDLRAETGRMQSFVEEAPLNLVYVSDYARMGAMRYIPGVDRDMFTAAATGAICQNVYLFCASEGLSTVVRGLVKRDALAEALHLRKAQKVTLAQSVGYPAE